MTPDSLTCVRELDCRWTNGIQVRLLWCQVERRLSVAVVDTRSGESFRIDLRDGERPMDVFNHPFAYAARRRTHWDSRPFELGGGRRGTAQTSVSRA